MSVVVVGLSHRTAPVSVLERVSVPSDELRKTLDELHRAETISEVLLLSTCNRIEVYADVARFHPALADITATLSRLSGLSVSDLGAYLYVHFAEAAVEHIMSVAAGLDSMVVGEAQILGQLRDAYHAANEVDSAGRLMHELMQQALRVGKRAHAETDLDSAGRSIVQAGLDGATTALGGPGELAFVHVLVVGAGSMSSLAAATAHRAGVHGLTIANRTHDRAVRVASELGATAVGLDRLDEALAAADLVISCTGSVGHVIDLAAVARAQAARGGRRQAYVDLALPRDVDPAAAELPGVTLTDLDSIGSELEGQTTVPSAIAEVRDLVAAEIAEYLVHRRAESVAPTVVALRARAAEVVAAELARFEQRRPDVDPDVLEELRRTVNRVVDKLLHAPTVRVKELAGAAEPSDYAAALRELFDLDPHDIVTVSTARLDEVIDIGGAR